MSRAKYIRLNMFPWQRNMIRHTLYHLNQGCFLTKGTYSMDYWIFTEDLVNVGRIQSWCFNELKHLELIKYDEVYNCWILTDKPYQIEYILK